MKRLVVALMACGGEPGSADSTTPAATTTAATTTAATGATTGTGGFGHTGGVHTGGSSDTGRPTTDTSAVHDTGDASDTGPDELVPGNVLIVLADDVGTDALAAYGGPAAIELPVFSTLQAEGVTFLRAYASPVCSPTRAAMYTGRFGRRTGVGGVIGDSEPPFALPDGEVTLAELVSPVGYDTSFAGKWHLINSSHPDRLTHLLDQGWAWGAGSRTNLGSSRTDFFRWKKNDNGVTALSTTYATTDTANDAIDRIAVMAEPWLLVASFNAPHNPLHEPPADLLIEPMPPAPQSSDAYRAMLQALDVELGRILDSMQPDVRARTTIVWMGDNGSQTAAHDGAMGNNEKGSMREGGVHVPLVISGHGVLQPGGASDALVHAVDIFPTVAELAGVDVSALQHPDGRSVALDGISLWPYLRGTPTTDRAHLFNERFQPNGGPPYSQMDWRSVTTATHKLILKGTVPSLRDLAAYPMGDGPNLLEDGIDADERALYDELLVILQAYDADLAYTW